MRYRSRLARTRVLLRRPTARLRSLPDFALIGAQRAGTSSLFRYLCGHPQVHRALRKEIDYFSVDLARPWSWYQAHFPLRLAGGVTFDATPQYFVHPLVPQRLRSVLPSMKLVVAVRDPADRTVSHYQLMSRLGVEHLDFEEALDRERSRIGPDLERLEREPNYAPMDFLRFSYVTRSRYAEQLQRWTESFPLSAFHFLCFDTFLVDPQSEWDSLLEFLDLDPWRPSAFRNWSTRTGGGANDAQRTNVFRRLGDDPEKFAALASREFPWPDDARHL